MNNIWDNLQSGFRVLAPMEDVTDTVFRQMVRSFGSKKKLKNGGNGKNAGIPDVFFTEFTNCDGLTSRGQARVIHRLKYSEIERPLIAQIWGKTPQNYLETAKMIVDLGFDGVDINMGCPEKSVIKQGACGALIDNPALAKEIIEAVQKGVGGKISVSVKTRIGFKTINTEEWCEFLLSQNLQALTVHGRTVKEMSDVPAHWDEIAKVVEIRNRIGLSTKIIGNGDVLSYADATQKISEFGVDGVMIGRGVFKNPFIFNPEIIQGEKGELFRNDELIQPKELLGNLLNHTQLWCETWKVEPEDDEYFHNPNHPMKYKKNFATLKKFFKIYCSGFAGSSELRARLMETNCLEEVEEILRKSEYEIV
jgi:tRNA-dihydrouridine synthase